MGQHMFPKPTLNDSKLLSQSMQQNSTITLAADYDFHAM